MNRLYLLLIIVFFCGCIKNKSGLSNPIVINSIDSICALCEPIRNSHFENIELDEYYMKDDKNPRNEQWNYGDSIAKYCNSDELNDLAIRHNSLAVRYVAFKMLLNKDPHKAVKVLIDNIDKNDSIIAIQLDEGFPELFSGLWLKLVQCNREISNISIADSIAVVEAVLKSKNRLNLYNYTSKDLQKVIAKSTN